MEHFASFRKNVEEMREQATVAASKARHLAENMTGKAQDLATVATENARVMAEKLKEDAKGFTEKEKWQEAATKARSSLFQLSLFNSTEAQELDEKELQAYGLTDSYKSFVRSLDYSTFRDFNEQELHSGIGFLMGEDDALKLNAWQERHAILALKVFRELDHLRYLLCPKRMSEEKFWLVYFSLAQSHLPEGCRTGKVPDLDPSKPAGLPDISTEPKSEPTTAQKVEIESGESSDSDDLDKYLNDVLHETAENVPSGDEEPFEDLDGYMEQLNVDVQSEGSQQDMSLPSDIVESLDDSPDEKGESDTASAQPAV